MSPLDFFIWIFLCIFTIVTLITHQIRKKNYKHGNRYDTRDVVALYTAPRVVLVWSGFLLLFLLANVSKAYLLLIFPVTYLIVKSKMTKKVLEENERGIPQQ
jgi:hypothetical protein